MPLKALCPIEASLLGLLSEGAMYAYPLDKNVRAHDMPYWPTALGSPANIFAKSWPTHFRKPGQEWFG